MTQAQVKIAVYEAERFLERAKVVLAAKSEGYSKDTAALRRASLDLTRALAQMRRGIA